MLKGERVVLRALREADFEAWCRLSDSDLAIALIGQGVWAPRTVERARTVWAGLLSAPIEERVSFAVEVDGAFIGTTGLYQIDRRSQHGWLGILLDPTQLGRGYGRDAIGTLLGWAFEIHNLRRLSLETWATNQRALRCYRAVGFVEEGRMRERQWVEGGYVDVIQMGLLRREWREQRGR